MMTNESIDKTLDNTTNYTTNGENLSLNYTDSNEFRKWDQIDNTTFPGNSNQNNKENNPVGHKKKNNSVPKALEQSRILIAESDPELLMLFKACLDSLGLESVTVDNGNTALETFLKDKKNGKDYHAMILDTHLKDEWGLDTVKKIRERDYRQKVVIITTSPRESLTEDVLKSTGIDDKNILVMPFRLSELIAVIKQ